MWKTALSDIPKWVNVDLGVNPYKSIGVDLDIQSQVGSILLRVDEFETISDFITSDKWRGKCVCPRSSVCLPVCLYVGLLARLLKNACMDLDEMLRVDKN